jgi:carboxyl-terminal processing protease
VRLGIKRTGEAETQIHRIVRAQIELKDSEAEGEVIEVGRKPTGEPYKIGVIDLPSFYMDMEASRLSTNYKSTTRDVKKILENFKSQGAEVVVLDLRRNGGGSLVEAIQLTGLFIDEGPVVQVKDSEGNVEHYDDTDAGMVWSGPLVVVTSKFSASASEILAGAVQDYHRGIIVGDKSTHGKGTVQTLRELGERLFPIPNPPNQGAIKITVQQFFRPSGDSTQQRGVMADIELPARTTHYPVGESDLEYALPFSKVTPVSFAAFDMVNAELLTALRERSEKRIAASEDFKKVNESIARYLAQKEQKTISLNEEKYFAVRANFDASKEEEKELEDSQSEKQGIQRNYYLDEVLSIAADYVGALSDNTVAKAR